MPSTTKRSRLRTLLLVVGGLVALGLLRQVAWPNDPPRAHIAWEGDSQSAPAPGVGTTADHARELLGEDIEVETLATSGALVGTLVARGPQADGTLIEGTRNVLVAWAGSNDLGAGADPQAVLAQLREYVTARRQAGWQVVVATTLPRTFATDVPGYEQRRQAYNDLLRAGWQGFADALADPGADPTVGRPGAQDDRTVYTEDRTHLNDEGRRLVAALFVEAISRLGID